MSLRGDLRDARWPPTSGRSRAESGELHRDDRDGPDLASLTVTHGLRAASLTAQGAATAGSVGVSGAVAAGSASLGGLQSDSVTARRVTATEVSAAGVTARAVRATSRADAAQAGFSRLIVGTCSGC